MSYDMKLVQSLQYPRDTIQKRSGTCIDLAILYAAMLNSVGIQPYLVFMDGHCFPMGLAPGNRFIPVETTGVADGYGGAMPFDKVVEYGLKTWRKLRSNGRYVLVDVPQCWVNGISNPELEPMPPDILEKWGIMALVDAPTPVEQKKTVSTGWMSGSQWVYVMRTPEGRTSNGQFHIAGGADDLQMVATAAYSVPGPNGATHYVKEEFIFAGRLSGQNLVAQTRSGKVTMDRRSIPPQGLPFRLNMTVDPDGNSMTGQFSNGAGQKAAIYLQRQ
jgi:hypothetical protein